MPSLFGEEPAPAKPRKRGVAQDVEPEPPDRRPGGASLPERLTVARLLAAILAEPHATEHDLYRMVRGSLYVLTASELLRVGGEVVTILTAKRPEAAAAFGEVA